MPGEETWYPPSRGWNFVEKKTVLSPARNQTPDALACRLVTISTIQQVISRPAEHQAHGKEHANESNY